MNPFEVYKDYVALKLHFSKWDYDWFLFQGRTGVSVPSFNKRHDKYWFEKLSRLHDPLDRILAHCATTEAPYIRNIVTDPDDVYLKWQSRQDSLTRVFEKEIGVLKKIFDQNFLYTHGMHPYLVREYLGGRISLETITIISDLTDCVSYWGEHSDDDPLFEQVIKRIMKYSPFLEYDAAKFKEILIKKVAD